MFSSKNCCYLYCNKDNNCEELKAFLYRSFSAKSIILFCMVNANLLNNKTRRAFISQIKQYAKKYGKKMESCLIILFSAKDDNMQKILIKTPNIQAFQDPIYFIDNFSFDQEYTKNYKLHLIKSDNCGLGKSEFIKKKKDEENLKKKKKIKLITFIFH